MRMATSGASPLEHGTRLRIYEHLLLLPGDHFRSIARAVDVGVSTAHHHLRVLIRDGLVHAEKRGGRSRYYVAGDEVQRERNGVFGKHWSYRATRIRVQTALGRFEECSAAEIAKVLGISRQLAGYHLIRLERQGFLTRNHGRYRVAGPLAAEDPP